MPLSRLIILAVAFFITSVISVVTGSTSLITVPVMIEFGIEPHVAVATNMMALIFMSVGGSLPFARKGVLDRRILPLSVVLTLIGSVIGAALLLHAPVKTLQLTIAIAMIAVAVFSLMKKDSSAGEHVVSNTRKGVGYLGTFVLAIYGGFFSGGYVTMLTAVFVLLFGLTFLQAVATTKVINVFSSAVATLIFAYHGVVDYRLGVILGTMMFLGAVVGGQVALRLPAVWLRRVFIAAVIALAVKMLFTLLR
ncbi:MAG: sulfite exporter TauE/SafE family protein [Candidatus Sulfotelmatobacter sp.]